MADFSKIIAQNEQRLGQYATRLFRIEAHIRRGERRAARARLNGFIQELDDFQRNVEFPFQLTLMGAQLGFMSGGGSIFRGRLPAALLGGVGGWLFGNSLVSKHNGYIEELMSRARLLDTELSSESTSPPT